MTLNQHRFSQAYHEGLQKAVEKKPQEYPWHPDKPIEQVVNRIINSMVDSPKNPSVNFNGDGFKYACRVLGIRYTKTAILEYWNSPT